MDPHATSPSPAAPAQSSARQQVATVHGELIVSIATYKERENIARLINEVFAAWPHAHILVIDDNSPDGTGQLVDEMAAQDARIKVIHRPGKLGLGSALIDAFQYSIKHGYQFMVNMDADFSHPPKYLPELIAGMANHDVMIGSRYVAGGKIIGWDLKRHLMSWAINTYSRIAFGLPSQDNSGSYRCYRLATIQRVDFDRIISRGYSFMEEFLFRCRQAGASIGETPIVFENRKLGKSNLNVMEIVKAVGCLLYLTIRR